MSLMAAHSSSLISSRVMSTQSTIFWRLKFNSFILRFSLRRALAFSIAASNSSASIASSLFLYEAISFLFRASIRTLLSSSSSSSSLDAASVVMGASVVMTSFRELISTPDGHTPSSSLAMMSLMAAHSSSLISSRVMSTQSTIFWRLKFNSFILRFSLRRALAFFTSSSSASSSSSSIRFFSAA